MSAHLSRNRVLDKPCSARAPRLHPRYATSCSIALQRRLDPPRHCGRVGKNADVLTYCTVRDSFGLPLLSGRFIRCAHQLAAQGMPDNLRHTYLHETAYHAGEPRKLTTRLLSVRPAISSTSFLEMPSTSTRCTNLTSPVQRHPLARTILSLQTF